MSTRINTNVEALNAQRNLSTTANQFAKSVEKLSSGLRINRAADDAAGLAISQKLGAQVTGLNQAQRNAQDGISMVQTAEGALNETHTMLQRMRELSVEASNSTLSVTDASSVNDEMQALKSEINRVAGATTFNGQMLLTGALGGNTIGGASTAKAGVTLAGTTTATDGLTITAVNAPAAAAATYHLDATVAGALTLKDAGNNAIQTISTSALAAGATATYNFDKAGVSISAVATGTGFNAVSQQEALNNKTVVVAAGANTAANFQIGANATDSLAVTFADARTATFGTSANAFDTALAAFNTAVQPGGTSAQVISAAQSMITQIDSAIGQVSTIRGGYGAVQNRLEHTIASIGVASENLNASQSRIKDLDVASEMVNFTKTQILQQAGTAILAQANSAPQGILSLLR